MRPSRPDPRAHHGQYPDFQAPETGFSFMNPFLRLSGIISQGCCQHCLRRGSGNYWSSHEIRKNRCAAFIGTSRVADVLKNNIRSRIVCVASLASKPRMPALFAGCGPAQCGEGMCAGALSYNGQRCTALKMLFVQAEIADAFIAKSPPPSMNSRGECPGMKGFDYTSAGTG